MRVVKVVSLFLDIQPRHGQSQVALHQHLVGHAFVNGHGVALQFAHQPALRAFGGQAAQQLVQLFLMRLVANNNSGAVLVVNQAKRFGGGTKLHAQRFRLHLEQGANAFAVQLN